MSVSKVVESGVRCGACSKGVKEGVYHEAAKDVARCYAMRYRGKSSKADQAAFASIAKKRGWMAA